MQNQKVIYTGNIPQCPYCEIPTVREKRNVLRLDNHWLSIDIPERFDEQGNQIITKKKAIPISDWKCCTCHREYTIMKDDDGEFYELS